MRRVVAVLAGAALLAGSACAAAGPGEEPAARTGPGVVAAFYPLAFAALEIAGERISLTDITPPGADAHDVELTSAQVLAIARADLVLYLGGGFQPAVEAAVSETAGEAVDLLAEVEDLPEDFRVRHDHGDEDEEDHDRDDPHDDDPGHDHDDDPRDGADDEHGHDGEIDPHIWLDPVKMAAIVDAIAAHLATADPEGSEIYRTSADRLTARLNDLHLRYEGSLEDCERRDLVVSHEAFGHLAARYDLDQIGISGLDPEAEPSPRRIIEVTRLARERGVTTIFYERQVSSRIARAIADEIGVGTAVLDPLETEPEEGGYFEAMDANLAALTDALGCRS